ncbi:putative nuclease HARBI1 [Ornithodoros turicata]|uniref:putative nuclease HARBI1 n=1 Tax=Ornithodoros turicata TaxID=34597 RepID=UPI0031388CD1
MSRGHVAELSHRFETSVHFPKSAVGRPRVPAENTFLIALAYLGSRTPFVQVADKFNVTESAAHKCVLRVLNFLEDISGNVITWPEETTRRQQTAANEIGKRIPNVIGAIDGSHIPIKTPQESPDSYCNRKKYHSIVLQGICNEEKKFIDVFVGCPGRSHDANWKKTYNYIHSRQRVIIENTFGLLKQRFRRLYDVDLDTIRKSCLFMLACCVLHNLCSAEHDLEAFQSLSTNEEDGSEAPLPVSNAAVHRAAEKIRKQIAEALL